MCVCCATYVKLRAFRLYGIIRDYADKQPVTWTIRYYIWQDIFQTLDLNTLKQFSVQPKNIEQTEGCSDGEYTDRQTGNKSWLSNCKFFTKRIIGLDYHTLINYGYASFCDQKFQNLG